MKFDNVVIKNKFLFISLGITIVLGIILRLLFYSYNRPLWSDEAALALNIINMNNYFITLDNGQAAPAIFMYVSKIMYQIIPYKELGLRLLPLIFSICSIFVFIKFTMEYLEKNFSIYIATTAFVLSYPLIYYAQEFKPYSWDLLSFMVILLSYFALKNIQNKWQCVFFAIIYSFLLYTSYTAFFAEFIVLLTLLLFHFDKFKKNIFIVITVFISFLAFYLSYKNSITSDYLHLYWNSGFLTLNLHQNFDLLIKNFDYIFSAKLPLLFFIISFFILSFKNIKNEKVFLIFFSIILAVILSILKIYPLMTRLTLYLIPIVIIYVAKIVDFINVKNKILYYFILILYGFVLLLPMGVYSYRMVLQKEAWLEDILTPLKVANEMSASDDIYIIADGGKWLYEYYKNIIPIKNKVIIEDKYSDDVEYLKHLDSYKKGQVYYWIYAHNINKQNRLTSVYNWAKDKKQFYFVYDKSLNALIRFSP